VLRLKKGKKISNIEMKHPSCHPELVSGSIFIGSWAYCHKKRLSESEFSELREGLRLKVLRLKEEKENIEFIN
jgi:hypothetical protein